MEDGIDGTNFNLILVKKERWRVLKDDDETY